MAAKIVNLRQARKHRARSRDRAAGDANAARHGEAKAARKLRSAQEDLDRRRLDGNRREDMNEPE